jgi:putative ABC transport system substrate-binding protein
MRRREFITLVGGAAAAWPVAAQQANRVVRIGYIGFGSASQDAPFREAFREGLRTLGYVEGNNFQIEARFAEGDSDLLLAVASELVRLNVDVIVTYATGVLAAQRATKTIPIVMASYTDAVATGLVATLAHPGGNVTGSTFFSTGANGKTAGVFEGSRAADESSGRFLVSRRPSENRGVGSDGS